MAVIVKMQPAAPAPGGLLAVDRIWNYKKQTPEAAAEAFVWFTKADRTEGLAMRGTLEHIAQAGISANGRQLVSLRINITDARPGRPFTVASLRPYKGSSAPGPLPKLASKLLGNSHQKVALLEEEETQHLRTFFASPVSGASEQVWRELERDASLAAQSRIGARIRKDIGQDLAPSAMEGLTQEQRVILRSRAVWLAARFAQQCWHAGEFRCDRCGFDPYSGVENTAVDPRSLMDVHHRDPLAEGVRVTELDDFQLLCPNCHRFVHAVMRTQNRRVLNGAS